MEYVLVDRDGRSREYFDTRDEAIEHLQREELENAGLTARWMLVVQDDDGCPVGDPEWAADLLAGAGEPSDEAAYSRSAGAGAIHLAVGHGLSSDCFAAALSYGQLSSLKVAWYGSQPTSGPAWLHPHTPASDTPVPALGETALP